MKTKIKYGLIIVVIIILAILAGKFIENLIQNSFKYFQTNQEKVENRITPTIPDKQTVKVVRIIDGDTIEIENKQIVRYIGIDTPETKDTKQPVGCFGIEASNKNKELVEGKEVYLEKDMSETDKYGRLLRYVWINDKMINEMLVAEGYAKVSTFPPDVKYKDLFINAQVRARSEKLGLWGNACN